MQRRRVPTHTPSSDVYLEIARRQFPLANGLVKPNWLSVEITRDTRNPTVLPKNAWGVGITLVALKR